MKRVLLVTDGLFHPTFFGRMALHRALRQLKDFSFDHTTSLEKLPIDLSALSALVLHYHHKKISTAALAKLDQYVKQGGGILALHAATASFKETLPYFEILGGRFIGHGPVERFEVRRVRDDIYGDIENFTVRDELYIHELQPGIEVHFTAQLEDKEIPVVWTYRYGKGRVCYAVPGHTTESMRSSTYQKILQRGLMWVCEMDT
jgi:type 1 glutamine amidotransferase